jgi:mRNA-degrading endonuclease RelE of RelBE toxin-antitoxin system
MKEPWRPDVQTRRVEIVSPKTKRTGSSAASASTNPPSRSPQSSGKPSSGWDVRLTADADREHRKLTDALLEGATIRFEELAEDPFPADSIELDNHPDLRRVPLEGDWRILYRVSRSNKRVLILRIRPREIAYEGLERKP